MDRTLLALLGQGALPPAPLPPVPPGPQLGDPRVPPFMRGDMAERTILPPGTAPAMPGGGGVDPTLAAMGMGGGGMGMPQDPNQMMSMMSQMPMDMSTPYSSPQQPGFDSTLGQLLASPDIYNVGMLDAVPDSQKPGYRPMPSVGFVTETAERDRRRFRPLLERMSRDLSLYRQHRGGVPQDFDKESEIAFRSAAISNLVNRLSSMMAGLDYSIEAPYRDEETETAAQTVEDFGYWSWEQDRNAYATAGGNDLQRDVFWYLFLYGRVCARVLPDTHDTSNPYTVTLLDPATCYPTFGDGKHGLIQMTRRYQSTVAQVLSDYAPFVPNLQNRLIKKLGLDSVDKLDWHQQGEVVEYWDTWNRVTTFMGMEVIKVAHKLGKVPFVYRVAVGEPNAISTPGGYYMDDEGNRNRVNLGIQEDLVEKGVSVFHYLVNTHLLKEALLTILYGEVEKMRRPATITYSAPHLVGKVPPPLRTRAGANNQRIKDLQTVEAIPTSPRPTDVAPVSQQLMEDWFGGAGNPAMGGMEMGANASGYSLDTLIAQAKELVIPYVKAFETFMQELIYHKLCQFREVLSPQMAIRVPNHNDYGPSDAMSDLTLDVLAQVGERVKVKVISITDQNLPMRAQTAAALNASGFWTQKRGMDYVGIKNPKKEFAGILKEKGLQDPTVMQTFTIPQGMIEDGNPELAKLYLQLAVQPQLQQQAMGGMPQGGGGGMEQGGGGPQVNLGNRSGGAEGMIPPGMG